MLTTFADLDDQALRDEVTTWAGRAAAAEAQLVLLIGELDRREAWGGHGVKSCAHWLSWRLGMGLVAARERIRVARALRSLPVTAEAFAAGRLSWTQVRAISRVADAASEQLLVDTARHTTGAHLERLARGIRRAQRLEQAQADPEAVAWRMRTRTRYDDDGNLTLTITLPAEQGAIVLAALDEVQARMTREQHGASAETPNPAGHPQPDASAHAPDPATRPTADASAEASVPKPAPPSRSDALVRIAQQTLSEPGRKVTRRARLTVLTDPRTGWARLHDGELLPPTALSRHDQGRTRREPGDRLRDLLSSIDGERCRYPSCDHTRFLHAHHVQYWRNGGRTDLANLILLCAFHHKIVHEHNYALQLRPDRTLQVTTSARLPIRPVPPWASPESLKILDHVSAETLPPHWCGEPLDLGYAVNVLLQQAA